MDKKEWERLKALIGPAKITPERITARRKPGPALKMRDEFYIGQRVRLSPVGKRNFRGDVNRNGVIVRMGDLSFCIPPDEAARGGARDFWLAVQPDGGRSASWHGNAAYFEPQS